MINIIDNRLESLVKYINKNDKIIDIGCDHALLDIYLIKYNIVNKIIVSDISKNALSQGISNINKYKFNNEIETRCGNGLEVLNNNDDINTVIISGMGTNTILKILDNHFLKKINKLIIQSNNDYYLLRKAIINLGYIIDKEEVIYSKNKLYINIVFIKGIKDYTDNELKYGTKDMLNKEEYYKYLINKDLKIVNNITDNKKTKEIENEIEYLNNLI